MKFSDLLPYRGLLEGLSDHVMISVSWTDD